MASSSPPLSVVAVPESPQDTATDADSPMTSETSLPTYTYIGQNVVNMVLTSTDVRNGQPGQLGRLFRNKEKPYQPLSDRVFSMTQAHGLLTSLRSAIPTYCFRKQKSLTSKVL